MPIAPAEVLKRQYMELISESPTTGRMTPYQTSKIPKDQRGVCHVQYRKFRIVSKLCTPTQVSDDGYRSRKELWLGQKKNPADSAGLSSFRIFLTLVVKLLPLSSIAADTQ